MKIVVSVPSFGVRIRPPIILPSIWVYVTAMIPLTCPIQILRARPILSVVLKMSKSGMAVTFAYNENGLRVRKTVTTTSAAETEFTWQGAQVMHAKTPQGRLHFYYDGSRPSHVDFNNY